ncbi:hypothetical protein M431DRAFT_317767 [Trichoderma harzianum CBS 226.95]|uniref:Uncharacterized protein n=1 Tax=Trichoderma harzianum CBS 226.95 TaxID=983964 RepID=A0A2T3ZWG3_TRIHA|nr:hypothetical protein M431DRAFT_317767 [Trichoderma harzianum CBS 226.95]PTB49155.1 hypothetical protein M431DRAFT_317767 [Trichoderma harzianum CBS 226.95]
MSSLLYFFVLIEAEPFCSSLSTRMSSLLCMFTSPTRHVDQVYEITRHHPRLIKYLLKSPSILQASSQRHLSVIQLSQSYLIHPTCYISVPFSGALYIIINTQFTLNLNPTSSSSVYTFHYHQNTSFIHLSQPTSIIQPSTSP